MDGILAVVLITGSTAVDRAGNGLGLSIVQAILDARDAPSR